MESMESMELMASMTLMVLKGEYLTIPSRLVVVSEGVLSSASNSKLRLSCGENFGPFTRNRIALRRSKTKEIDDSKRTNLMNRIKIRVVNTLPYSLLVEASDKLGQ